MMKVTRTEYAQLWVIQWVKSGNKEILGYA